MRIVFGPVGQTLDRYSHVTMSMQQEAAARWDRLLGDEDGGATEPDGDPDTGDAPSDRGRDEMAP